MREDQFTVYIPNEQQKEHLPDRLQGLGKRRDRSLNYLIIKAIEEFLERNDKSEVES